MTLCHDRHVQTVGLISLRLSVCVPRRRLQCAQGGGGQPLVQEAPRCVDTPPTRPPFHNTLLFL